MLADSNIFDDKRLCIILGFELNLSKRTQQLFNVHDVCDILSSDNSLDGVTLFLPYISVKLSACYYFPGKYTLKPLISKMHRDVVVSAMC